MKFETPSFWYRSDDSSAPLLETAMAPLACLYGLGHKIHQVSQKPKRFDVPVICIGNVVAGGSGKTPTAMALTKIIARENLSKSPFFLTRGYGGYFKGPILAIPSDHDFKQIGDEALLLSTVAPTIISENRALGAEMAIEEDADLIVMDDGLQNPGIYKDIKLVVIHGDTGFGNKKILPAGPLRSPLSPSIADADGFIIIGEDQRKTAQALPANTPVFNAKISATKAPPKDLSYIAFAGIGYPDKFFTTLKELGCNVIKTKSFPDHFPYHEQDIDALSKQAEEQGAQLITTEKDHQRLPEKFQDKVLTLPVELSFKNEDALVTFLKDKLARS